MLKFSTVPKGQHFNVPLSTVNIFTCPSLPVLREVPAFTSWGTRDIAWLSLSFQPPAHGQNLDNPPLRNDYIVGEIRRLPFWGAVSRSPAISRFEVYAPVLDSLQNFQQNGGYYIVLL